jgi:hypothetical protein
MHCKEDDDDDTQRARESTLEVKCVAGSDDDVNGGIFFLRHDGFAHADSKKL